MRLAIKALLIDHAAEVLDVVAEHDLAASLTPRMIGTDSAADCDRRAELQRDATREAEAIIMRERSGQSARPAFRGVKQALQALDELRLDGAAIGVSSVWDLLDPKSTGRVEGSISRIDRVAPVAREWALCFEAGWDTLTPEQARTVCEWSVVGIGAIDVPRCAFTARHGEAARQQESKHRLRVRGRLDATFGGGVDRDHEPTPAEIGLLASAAFGVSVSDADVLRIRHAGVVEMYRRLKACGLTSRDERLEMMTKSDDVPVFDLTGWKQIADLLSVDERTAQRWQADGLPIYEYQRSIVALRSELRAWQRGRMKPRRVG